MAYQPIEDYGLIGNMHTVALVGKNGSIDWFCPRKFDDASIFAAILDDEKGGHFCIYRPEGATLKQFYWSDTNVLVTRFLCEDGVAEIIDFMPVGIDEDDQRQHWLIRHVKMVRGAMTIRMECNPAFNYARDPHHVELHEHGAAFTSETYSFALSTEETLQQENGAVVTEMQMQQGDSAVFVLAELQDGDEVVPPPLTEELYQQYFHATVHYWRRWLSNCTYKGRWREIVYRSALVMKLMTYEPTGAIVASPTTSLPEAIGGGRNWDYRYSWVRDSAFTLYGLMRIGFTEEAGAYINWLRKRIHEPNEPYPLQIMYTIDGDHEIPETELHHLEGYKGSRPVRIGNGAAQQLQLDIFGELMDSIYLYNKYGERIGYDLWEDLVQMLDWVADNWTREDKGIWEIRGVDQPFVYSKLMCWVALDRGIRLSEKRSLPAPRDRWYKVRDMIYTEIMERGWNDEIGSFTQYYDGHTLDASNLIMPLVFFMSPHDQRMEGTINATMRPPEEGGLLADSLVYRYNTDHGIDGIEGDEGTFNMCTFWLAEALARNGRIDDARHMFEQMLGYANHLGLFAEETGERGQALGNYPQAFTHLALISAAFNLDRILNEGKMP
jgi:GH15 family glucan-1,4-alpha-glucosidase